MSFDLCSELLKVLHDRAVDGTTEVGMLISNDPSFVTYAIEYILGLTSRRVVA